MNYTKKLNALLSEATKAVQYKELSKFQKFAYVFAMLPLFVMDALMIAFYYVFTFVLNGLGAPFCVLSDYVKKEREGSKAAADAVICLVAMPFLFVYQVYLSLASFVFYVLWFTIMAVTYVISLGGIKWRPYITEAEFNENEVRVSKNDPAELKKMATIEFIFAIAGITIPLLPLLYVISALKFKTEVAE